MADKQLGESFTRYWRFVAGSTAETIANIGFRPDYIMVKRIDSGFATDGLFAKSEWYRSMTNGDALQTIVQDCATSGLTHGFETTNGITLTINASGVDDSFSAIGAISAIDLTSVPIVTDNDHGLSDGDTIRITQVGGTIELNNRRFRLNNVTTNTFELQDPETRTNIDGSNFTAFTSGGQWNLLTRVDADRDVFDAETFDITLGTAVLANDIEHVLVAVKYGEFVNLGDIG